MNQTFPACACPSSDSGNEASGEDSEAEPMASSSGSGNDASDDKSQTQPEIVEYGPLQPAPIQPASSFEQDVENLLRSSDYLGHFNATYLPNRPGAPPTAQKDEKSVESKNEPEYQYVLGDWSL